MPYPSPESKHGIDNFVWKFHANLKITNSRTARSEKKSIGGYISKHVFFGSKNFTKFALILIINCKVSMKSITKELISIRGKFSKNEKKMGNYSGEN